MICKMVIEYRSQAFMSGPGQVLYVRLSKWTIVKVNNEKFMIDFHPSCHFIKRNVTKLHTLKREHFKILNLLAEM
jgi:hypothetical protein